MECCVCGMNLMFNTGIVFAQKVFCTSCGSMKDGRLKFKCDHCGEVKYMSEYADESGYKSYCKDCLPSLITSTCDKCERDTVDFKCFPKHTYCDLCCSDYVEFCGYCGEDVDTEDNCVFGTDCFGNAKHFHTECYHRQKILFRKFSSENPRQKILFRKFESENPLDIEF